MSVPRRTNTNDKSAKTGVTALERDSSLKWLRIPSMAQTTKLYVRGTSACELVSRQVEEGTNSAPSNLDDTKKKDLGTQEGKGAAYIPFHHSQHM